MCVCVCVTYIAEMARKIFTRLAKGKPYWDVLDIQPLFSKPKHLVKVLAMFGRDIATSPV